MSRVTTFEVPPEQEELFFKSLRWGNQFVNPRIIAKERPLSRAQKQAVADVSFLPDIAVLWNSLGIDDQNMWADAAFYSGQTGYALFIQDTSYRIKNSISGLATPDVYHQYKVGKIHLPNVAQYNLFAQDHYDAYYIARKITGSQDRLEPVLITETPVWPFFLAINFKTNLVSNGAGSFAFCGVEIEWWDGEDDQVSYIEHALSLQSGWDYKSGSLVDPGGTITRYSVYFEFNNVYGDVWFDVPELIYSSQNFVRDSNCDNIDEDIPNLGVTIEPIWGDAYPSHNATIESVYPFD